MEKKEYLESVQNKIKYYKEKEKLSVDWETNKEVYQFIDLL